MYRKTKEARRAGNEISKQEKESIRAQEMKKAMHRWKMEMIGTKLGKRPVLDEIIKNWESWQISGPPNLTFKITQLL